MVTAQEWLGAGAAALAAGGAPAVRIDKLAAALGATKGSYYHHFGSARGYRLALLEHLEAEHTGRLIAVAESDGGSAEQRLRRLLDLVLDVDRRPDLERVQVALRAWAHQDPDVLAAQQRIDRTRTAYLERLWRGTGLSPDEAEAAAWLTHIVVVGGRHLLPPLGPAELRRVYDLVLRLLPPPVPTDEPTDEPTEESP